MRRLLISMIIASIALVGCGKPLTVAGKEYPTYGLINYDTHKSTKVCYEVSVGNVVLSALFFWSIVVPVYFVGFSLYNPTREKTSANDKCSIDG